MSTDHAQEFAAAALQAFDDRGLSTDDQVRRAGGPSNTTMTALRKAARGELGMKEPRSDMLRRIEEAAGWRPGDARKLWRTGMYPAMRSAGDVQEQPTAAAPSLDSLSDDDLLAEVARRFERKTVSVDAPEPGLYVVGHNFKSIKVHTMAEAQAYLREQEQTDDQASMTRAGERPAPTRHLRRVARETPEHELADREANAADVDRTFDPDPDGPEFGA